MQQYFPHYRFGNPPVVLPILCYLVLKITLSRIFRDDTQCLFLVIIEGGFEADYIGVLDGG